MNDSTQQVISSGHPTLDRARAEARHGASKRPDRAPRERLPTDRAREAREVA